MVVSPDWRANARRERAGNALIVIIDDSICVRKIVETTLRREGYATMGFADGYTALRWLTSEEARLPALIILDLTMPKMDGYTVLHYLRKHPATASTPVIILSGRTSVVDRLKGRLAGACVYLTKPFHKQAILELVRTQLAPPVAVPLGAMCLTRPAASSRSAVRPITLKHMEE